MAFESRVFVVSGGASGVGLAVVKSLLENKGIVYIADVAAESPDSLQGLSGNWTYCRTDVTSREQCHALFGKIIAKEGALQGCVNCAGIFADEGEIASDEILHRVFAVNMDGVFHMATEAFAAMKSYGKGGVIVNIGSEASLRGFSRCAVYCGTKHAVLGFTRAWARDWAKYGIRVNMVAPGMCLRTAFR
jgi:NAD(P)-dependent dehydrogenase (short-subunit alcohol dehydrogenase family)